MLDIFQYSTLLVTASMALFTVLILFTILILTNIFTAKSKHQANHLLNTLLDKYGIKFIGFLAISASIAVLMYQYIYFTPICELCWWQRIFMFPMDFIVLWAIYFKIKKVEWLTLILSFIGFCFASYHYYYHYRAIVMREKVDMACGAIGLTPACSESSILVFGFATIPLMASLTFLSIFIISSLITLRSKK